MPDFKLGWSDIDILCLTKCVLSEEEAERLVNLRHNLLIEEVGNPYYRSFEGDVLSFDEFREKQYERVVYWGTSGQRITDNYLFDAFSLFELIKYAVRTDNSIYSCGWLLDIARCIYMIRTLQIRKNPLKNKEDEDIKEWLCSLGEEIQLFADVLEERLYG